MAKLRYISLFSGIEAWSCAVAGMPEYEAVAFSEIDPFACAVLAHHYPNVPNLGDVTKIDGGGYRDKIDLIVGGSPCQGFSVGGRKEGLRDPRSALAMAYVRLVGEVRPKWLLWENVPGVMSCGQDFRCFLAALDGLGYSLAWSVLNSEFWGVPQRRRRVFLVGHLGADWERPAKVLLEPESMSRNPPPRRHKRKNDTGGAEDGPGGRSQWREVCPTVTSKWAKGSGGPAGNECHNLVLQQPNETAPSLTSSGAAFARTGQQGSEVNALVLDEAHEVGEDRICEASAGALCARDGEGVTSSIDGKLIAEPKQNDTFATLCASGAGCDRPSAQGSQLDFLVVDVPRPQYVVRRIVPEEAEALQGFPRGWTDIEYRGKPAPDTARYRAIGNSMTVPVMAWIARRILAVEKGEL